MTRALFLSLFIGACGKGGDDTADTMGAANSLWANGDVTTDMLDITVIATSADGLNEPRDLDFNPGVDGELWIVNRKDDSATIVEFAGEEGQLTRTVHDPYALHFLDSPSSIAFGAVTFPGSTYHTFGTCQESTNSYNQPGTGNGFMGPSLWSADPDIFGFSNPEAIDFLGFDLGSHLDMLHESPNCMGITWDEENVYWVFDGEDGSIVRYDFATDHGVGYDDHSDGIIARYVIGELSRVKKVVSHIELDLATGLLYVADTGNNRVAVLDTATGERGSNLSSIERGVKHYEMLDASFETLIDGASAGLEVPAGLALVGDLLLIGDNSQGKIYAYDLDGNEVGSIDTGLNSGALMGFEANGLDEVWVTDVSGDRVLRVRLK